MSNLVQPTTKGLESLPEYHFSFDPVKDFVDQRTTQMRFVLRRPGDMTTEAMVPHRQLINQIVEAHLNIKDHHLAVEGLGSVFHNASLENDIRNYAEELSKEWVKLDEKPQELHLIKSFTFGKDDRSCKILVSMSKKDDDKHHQSSRTTKQVEKIDPHWVTSDPVLTGDEWRALVEKAAAAGSKTAQYALDNF